MYQQVCKHIESATFALMAAVPVIMAVMTIAGIK